METVKDIMWCDTCGYTSIDFNGIVCPNCDSALEKIGFVEGPIPLRKNPGGRTTPGKCKCGNNLANKGLDSDGRRRYRSQCEKCRVKARKHKKGSCEHCGFTPENKGLLDVDHIDGDRSNNDPSNLQTLCKPCHQIKTIVNKDTRWKNAKR